MQHFSYSRFLFQNSSFLQPCRCNSYNGRQFIRVTEIKMGSSWLRSVNRARPQQHFKSECCKERLGGNSFVGALLYSFKEAFKRMPVALKSHSMNIVKHCAEQCEFIIAHRIRRSQQIISLYTKIWDEMALKHFVSKFRRKIAKKGRYLLFSAVGVYNWDQERITDEEVLRYKNEMEVIKELKKKKYCIRDKAGKCECFNCLGPGESEWDAFVNEENLIVWKKEEMNHTGEGLYCYKLYGRYDDVTALDFLEAQVDLEYRLAWDSHAVKLTAIDTERSTRSDVIYWETKWPTPFSNRDYVFNRRYHIDKKNKLVTLVNKSTVHPSCPVYPNKQRVREYWSYMVIKPYGNVDEPGLEFSLTYFDNPGMSMPSSLSSYVTVTGMPVFLKNLHDAAKNLKDKRKGPSILFDDDEDSEKSSDKGRSKKPPSSSPDDKPKEPKKKCPQLPDLPDLTKFQKIQDSFFFF